MGAPTRFESDFMLRYMAGKSFSEEANEVLTKGRELWCEYYKYTDSYTTREQFKLNRPDVGWYQIRNALKNRNKNGDYKIISFDEFEVAYKKLSEKLRPQVYTYGFLRE